MAELAEILKPFEVFHGRFLLDQSVQRVLNSNAHPRCAGWTANPSDFVVLASAPDLWDEICARAALKAQHASFERASTP